MELEKKEWQRMQKADIREAVLEELTDISDMEIDMTQPLSERLQLFLEKVDNPFLVRMGDYILKIEYADCEETLEERVKQYVSRVTRTKHQI